MSTHRYCLLGLPRTGSQYIAKMISNSANILDIEEPFTISKSLSSITVNNNLIRKNKHIDFDSIETQIKHVIECFKNANIDQPLLMRLFLVDVIAPYIPNLIEELSKLNFKFLIIRRENAEHHLLSYVIARHTNIWNTKYTNNQPYPIGTLFNITNLNDAEWLYSQRMLFDNLLNQLNLECDTIRYEHAVEDIQQMNITVNPIIDLKKQISGDPYDLISDAPAAKQFLEKLLNK
jgi:hypothetical protein